MESIPTPCTVQVHTSYIIYPASELANRLAFLRVTAIILCASEYVNLGPLTINLTIY